MLCRPCAQAKSTISRIARRRKIFFLEKKEQKTFICCGTDIVRL
jgi:hypothetical protein